MPHVVTACQVALASCYSTDGVYRPAVVRRNLEHIEQFVRAQHAQAPASLYLLPEFALQGWSTGVPLEQLNASAVRVPGPETERLGALARELGAYVAGTGFEAVPEYPGRHFLTGFVMAPDGTLALRYRKLYAVSAKTRPGDLYGSYVARFGRESMFPVIRTPLGRIGMVVAWDAIFPECVRRLALRGAEIILHPLGSGRQASEAGTGFEFYGRARAPSRTSCTSSAPTSGRSTRCPPTPRRAGPPRSSTSRAACSRPRRRTASAR
jgi:predicted amidohydrolase